MDLSKLIAQATAIGKLDVEISKDVKPNGALTPKPTASTQRTESTQLVQKIIEIPKPPVIEDALCLCGHPKDAHVDGTDDCEILECIAACTSYCPASQVPTAANLAAERSQAEQTQAKELESKIVPTLDIYNLAVEGDMRDFEVLKPIHDVDDPGPLPEDSTIGVIQPPKSPVRFHIPRGTKPEQACAGGTIVVPQAPTVVKPQTAITNSQIPPATATDGAKRCSMDALVVVGANLENCGHLCKCGKWWSHGLRDKCRFPDLVEQGLCFDCLGVGGEKFDPLTDWDKDAGRITPEGQIKISNQARIICKDMTIQQLTDWIEFNARRIEELRVQSMTARKMRSDLEEEELANIPEEEREKWLQAIRNGGQKERKARTRKAKTDEGEAGVRQSALEKNITRLMRTMGKTRVEVEALLAD